MTRVTRYDLLLNIPHWKASATAVLLDSSSGLCWLKYWGSHPWCISGTFSWYCLLAADNTSLQNCHLRTPVPLKCHLSLSPCHSFRYTSAAPISQRAIIDQQHLLHLKPHPHSATDHPPCQLLSASHWNMECNTALQIVCEGLGDRSNDNTSH